MQIRIIKTWHGRKWAVVDEQGNVLAYKGGVTVFPFNADGHAQAIKARIKLRERQAA